MTWVYVLIGVVVIIILSFGIYRYLTRPIYASDDISVPNARKIHQKILNAQQTGPEIEELSDKENEVAVKPIDTNDEQRIKANARTRAWIRNELRKSRNSKATTIPVTTKRQQFRQYLRTRNRKSQED